jgi:hypothetical protein
MYSRISSDFRQSSLLSFQTHSCHIYTANFNSFNDFYDNNSKFLPQRTHVAYINLFFTCFNVAGDNSYRIKIMLQHLLPLICLSDHAVAYFCSLIDRSTSNVNSSIIFFLMNIVICGQNVLVTHTKKSHISIKN